MGDRRKELQKGMRNAFGTPEESNGPGMWDNVMNLLGSNPQPVQPQQPVPPVDPSLQDTATEFFKTKKNRGY